MAIGSTGVAALVRDGRLDETRGTRAAMHRPVTKLKALDQRRQAARMTLGRTGKDPVLSDTRGLPPHRPCYTASFVRVARHRNCERPIGGRTDWSTVR